MFGSWKLRLVHRHNKNPPLPSREEEGPAPHVYDTPAATATTSSSDDDDGDNPVSDEGNIPQLCLSNPDVPFFLCKQQLNRRVAAEDAINTLAWQKTASLNRCSGTKAPSTKRPAPPPPPPQRGSSSKGRVKLIKIINSTIQRNQQRPSGSTNPFEDGSNIDCCEDLSQGNHKNFLVQRESCSTNPFLNPCLLYTSPSPRDS